MNTDAIDIRNAYRKMAKRPRSEIDEEEASNIVRSGVDGHTASFKVEEEELEGSKTLKANKHVTETIKRSVVPFGQDASSSSPSFIEEDPPTTPRPTPRYTAIHLTDISDTTPSPPSTRPIRPPRAGRTGYKGSRESHRQAARFSQDNGIIPHKKANNARAARAIMSELTDVHDMEELNSDGELYEEGGAKRRKLHLVDTDEEVVVIPKQVNTEDAPRSSQTMVVDDLVQAAAAPVLPNPPPGHDAVVQDVRPIYDADMPSMAREHPARVWNQEIHAMSPELQPMIKWAYERLVIDEEDEELGWLATMSLILPPGNSEVMAHPLGHLLPENKYDKVYPAVMAIIGGVKTWKGEPRRLKADAQNTALAKSMMDGSLDWIKTPTLAAVPLASQEVFKPFANVQDDRVRGAHTRGGDCYKTMLK